jgi:hypothetical protein
MSQVSDLTNRRNKTAKMQSITTLMRLRDRDKEGCLLSELCRKYPDFTGSTGDFSLSYAPVEICLRNQNVGCIP